MYPIETRNNYLVLTPDGVGSTYLQRALTVYLQCVDLDYWNTHELLNGLANKNGNLYKDWTPEYSQSLEEICNLLLITGNLLISRIANYHVTRRFNKNQEDYSTLYQECDRKFNNILFCERDPFEYALSWSIRSKSKKPNVYSVTERTATHLLGTIEPIDLNYFNQKLKQYSDYEYWAHDNFNITHKVNYDDLHNNIDLALQNITGLPNCVEERYGISLQDYSQFRYLSSMYTQTKDPIYVNNACVEKLEPMCELYLRISQLNYSRRLPTPMPIKMNTLADKCSRITNFDQAVEKYNIWAASGNRHPEITQEDISKKINQEAQIYANR